MEKTETSARLNIPIDILRGENPTDIVQQDHPATRRVPKPMLNFKSFQPASSVIAGFKPMHMICKDLFAIDGVANMPFAEQYCTLAQPIRRV